MQALPTIRSLGTRLKVFSVSIKYPCTFIHFNNNATRPVLSRPYRILPNPSPPRLPAYPFMGIIFYNIQSHWHQLVTDLVICSVYVRVTLMMRIWYNYASCISINKGFFLYSQPSTPLNHSRGSSKISSSSWLPATTSLWSPTTVLPVTLLQGLTEMSRFDYTYQTPLGFSC